MKVIKEIVPYVIIIIIVILVRMFIVSLVKVQGISMNPTFLQGDILILNKKPLTGYKFNRFDIVVVKYNNGTIIKRVIGLPGERIEYLENVLYVNGEIVKEDFEHGYTDDFTLNEFSTDKIPDDSYFVVGDNRGASMDSRIVGFIKQEDIVGRIGFRVFPFNSFGFVK